MPPRQWADLLLSSACPLSPAHPSGWVLWIGPCGNRSFQHYYCRHGQPTFLFHYLLKAPTLVGRALMDRVEGFRPRRLSIATACRRLRVLTIFHLSTNVFCLMLLRLGVETAWSQKFSQALAQAQPPARSTQRRKLFTVVVFRRSFRVVFGFRFCVELRQLVFQRSPPVAPLPHRPRVPVAAVRPAARLWRGRRRLVKPLTAAIRR